jgi:hypothetical protein
MNCDLAGCLLDEYLENGLSQRDCQQLEKHLARCPHCAAELRRRPAFERDLRRALATSVRPLSLSAELSRRIIESAEQSLHRAVWSRRVALTFRLMSGALAAMLVLVAIFALLGHIPVASHFKPIALLPANKLPLSSFRTDTLVAIDQPAPRLAATSTGWLPRASLLVEPRDMRPRVPFTMTVLLQSDLPQPLETVRLDLEISGPTGFYHFGLAVKGPLPAHGVSIFRVTPDLLAEPCEEQYLIAPTDVFSLPGVYTLRVTLFDPVVASR